MHIHIPGAQYFTADISSRWHCGLRNVSSTCYMNSLLQGMFMTPEFRKVNSLRYPPPEKNKIKSEGELEVALLVFSAVHMPHNLGNFLVGVQCRRGCFRRVIDPTVSE